MRKIILWMSISLDGYFEGPNHELDWHCVDDELLQHMNDELGKMGAFLHGRRMYDLMAHYWPTADRDHPNNKITVEFAGIWKRLPKVVYSTTLPEVGWNSTLVRAVVPEEVRALQAQPGGDMPVGGAGLAASFIRLDLIDEYRIYVHPVVLGAGKPLFGAGLKQELALLETKRFGNGVVMLRYGRASVPASRAVPSPTLRLS